MEFVTQPFEAFRLGDYLIEHLADPQWTVFRAAIAFVRRSGTQYVRDSLEEFSNRAEVKLSVGIDLNGTSREGLLELLNAVPNGQIWIYRNSGPNTFHPKVYLFKNNERADVIVGSGNLTRGGLFTNYEASLATSLDVAGTEDADFLQSVEDVLDSWSQQQDGVCYLLTPELLEQLGEAGLVRSEAELPTPQTPPPAPVTTPDAPPTMPNAGLFVTVAVPPPPTIPTRQQPELEEEPEVIEIMPTIPALGIVPVQVGGVSAFVMTLQNTDVGVGQTTTGTSRRSPEVFIPLAALDQNPTFWTFPDQFNPDTEWDANHPDYRRDGLGKLDRMGVPMRIGVVESINMFFNPRKKDFRLRSEAIRSSGNIGDIILIQTADPANGFEYDVQVAPQGSPLFQQLQPHCTSAVPNSQKRFGYF